MLTTSHIRNWIRNGALEELEMVVLEGQVGGRAILMIHIMKMVTFLYCHRIEFNDVAGSQVAI